MSRIAHMDNRCRCSHNSHKGMCPNVATHLSDADVPVCGTCVDKQHIFGRKITLDPEMNLQCTDCGKEYYSASVSTAEENTVCENCGTFTVRAKE